MHRNMLSGNGEIALRLSAALVLGVALGLNRELHGEPEAQDDLNFEADGLAAGQQVADEDHSRERADNLEHEHHRILHHLAGIEFDEGGADGRHDDLRIEQRGNRHALAQKGRFRLIR